MYYWKVTYADVYGTFAGWLLFQSEHSADDYPGVVTNQGTLLAQALFPGRELSCSVARQDIDSFVTFHAH